MISNENMADDQIEGEERIVDEHTDFANSIDVKRAGMGVGDGKKDVSDQIEDDELLLGLTGDNEKNIVDEQIFGGDDDEVS
jgi:hypothetical protein